jgi:Xaa-Pro aminopeptidase
VTSERIHTQIPRSELEPRWAFVRGVLEERDLDALVVLEAEDFLGAHVKWLTDRPVNHSYYAGVVFHRDDLMTLIEHGPIGGRMALDDGNPEYPGIGEVRTTAAFHPAGYTNTYEAEIVCEIAEDRGYRRLATAGRGAMPHGFVQHLADNAGAELVDITDEIDHFKAIKTPWEIEEIRKTALLQDACFERILAEIRPGMRDLDAMALAQHEGRIRGAEQGIFLFGSAPKGQPALGVRLHFQNRTLGEGDQIFVMIENNGPAGFYTELGRIVTLGPASNALIEACEQAREAQDHTLALLKPGAVCAEIAAAHDEWLAERGKPPERRLYAHAQGYALVERPMVRADETMSLAAGMSMTVHPRFPEQDAHGYICDNYIIEEDGPGECLHETEKKVFEVEV